MNHLLGKVKRKKKPIKLISDRVIFDININEISPVDYAPDHNLDEDSWFRISELSSQTYCLDILKHHFNSVDYDDMSGYSAQDLRYLIAVQDNNFHFQKITPSMQLSKKLLSFGETVQLETTPNRVVINDLPDAIYHASEDVLYFRNIATISSIFKGVDSLYKEATNEEVESFLDESFVDLSGDYGTEQVSKPNRKRIALVKDTLDSMKPDDRESIFVYINDYCSDKLTFDNDSNSFQISSDNDLKLLLYGIEQRFYTTPFSKERRLANSVQTM